MKHSGPRAKCHAVGSPLDRGVRHRLGLENATHAAPPPYTKSYGTWKTLRERHSSSRSSSAAVVCSGAHSSRPRQEALRASAVPARSEGICTQSALTSPMANQAKFSGSSKRGTPPKSMASTNDLNWLRAAAG